MTCTDADADDNAVVNVEIKAGDFVPNRFKMAGLDLRTTGQSVDFEDSDVPNNMYSLTVTGSDSPTNGTPNVAMTTIIIMASLYKY